MTPEPFNWTALGTGLAVAFVAFMQVWQNWRAGQIAKELAINTAKTNKTAQTVDEIHVLTNGSMALQKKTLAETTAAKSAITKDPADIEASRLAMIDYQDHVGKLAKVESQKS